MVSSAKSSRVTFTGRLVEWSRWFFSLLVEPLAIVLEPHTNSRIVRNIPNAISVLRAILGGAAAWGIYHATSSPERWTYIVVILLLVLSDGIDGTLARRLKVTSVFGAIFDPLSDKLLIGGLVYGLCLKFDSPFFWKAAIVLASIELANIMAGAVSGALVNSQGTSEKAGASNIGKVKMGVECAAVFLGWILLPMTPEGVLVCGSLVTFAIPLAIGSLYGYLSKAVRVAISLARRDTTD
jgi:phosphatidylglycerophosphate synthase